MLALDLLKGLGRFGVTLVDERVHRLVVEVIDRLLDVDLVARTAATGQRNQQNSGSEPRRRKEQAHRRSRWRFPAGVIALAPRAANRGGTAWPSSGAGDAAGFRPGRRAESGGFRDRRGAPGIGIGEQRGKQAPGQRMTGADAAKMPDDRSTGEVEIA